MKLGEQRSPYSGGAYRPPEKYVIEASQREQAMSLISEDTLANFLKEPERERWDWVIQHKGDGKPLEDILKKKLGASPVRDTNLVAVELSDKDPRAAAELLEQLMQFYGAKDPRYSQDDEPR